MTALHYHTVHIIPLPSEKRTFVLHQNFVANSGWCGIAGHAPNYCKPPYTDTFHKDMYVHPLAVPSREHVKLSSAEYGAGHTHFVDWIGDELDNYAFITSVANIGACPLGHANCYGQHSSADIRTGDLTPRYTLSTVGDPSGSHYHTISLAEPLGGWLVGVYDLGTCPAGHSNCIQIHDGKLYKYYSGFGTWNTSGSIAISVLPTVITESANNINQTEATLNGTLTNDGGEACTCHFEYAEIGGTTHTTSGESKTTGELLSANLTDLSIGTRYKFRMVAENSAGTTYGDYMYFTTESPALKEYSLAQPELLLLLRR